MKKRTASSLLLICLITATGLAIGLNRLLEPEEAATYAGHRSLVTWLPGEAIRVDMAVWYPTRRTPTNIMAQGWFFQAARNAPPLENPNGWPLLLLSHDSTGSRYAHNDLAINLAQKGFIVVAPTHDSDNAEDMRLLFTADQLPRRALQLKAALDTILTNADLGPLIDRQRIIYLGFGNGGTAGLLLAGAKLTPDLWPLYCRDNPDNPYCAPVIRSQMDTLTRTMRVQSALTAESQMNRATAAEARARELTRAGEGISKTYARIYRAQRRQIIEFKAPPAFLPPLPPLPNQPVLNDNRINAMILVSPGYSMLFERESLHAINLPILFILAGKDNLNNPAKAEGKPVNQADVLHRAIAPPTPNYIIIPNADLPAFQSACPKSAGALPDLCNSVTPAQRLTILHETQNNILSFIKANLN